MNLLRSGWGASGVCLCCEWRWASVGTARVMRPEGLVCRAPQLPRARGCGGYAAPCRPGGMHARGWPGGKCTPRRPPPTLCNHPHGFVVTGPGGGLRACSDKWHSGVFRIKHQGGFLSKVAGKIFVCSKAGAGLCALKSPYRCRL